MWDMCDGAMHVVQELWWEEVGVNVSEEIEGLAVTSSTVLSLLCYGDGAAWFYPSLFCWEILRLLLD